MMEKAITFGGGTNYVNDYKVLGNLGDAYRGAGDRDNAVHAYRRAIQAAESQLGSAPQDARLLAHLAVYRTKSADREKGLAQAARAREIAPSDATVGYKSAIVHELAGQREQALRALSDAIAGGYSLEEIRHDPDLVQLRKDPRFQRLSASSKAVPK